MTDSTIKTFSQLNKFKGTVHTHNNYSLYYPSTAEWAAYGPTKETMEVLKTTKKSWHLDTLEKYYIYIYTQPK
jgi:hypothetical protein